jgi:hypothetical protein
MTWKNRIADLDAKQAKRVKREAAKAQKKAAAEYWWVGVPTSRDSARIWKGYATEEASRAVTNNWEGISWGALLRCQETTWPCTEAVLREALRMGGFPNDLVVSP